MVGKRYRLISTRKVAGFSQERLAEVVGVERSTVQRWERGETCPQPWARPRLARALGISDQALGELLNDPTEPENAATAPSPMLGQAPDGFSETCDDNRICEQRGAHTLDEVPFDPMKRRTLLSWGLGVTASSSLSRSPATSFDVMPEATPGLDIDPIEHLRQMKKTLMDNDNMFGANSAILSTREQIGNLHSMRPTPPCAWRHRVLAASLLLR